MDVTVIENGDYIKVKGVDFGSGATDLDVRVATAGAGGNIEVRLDSQTGTRVGTCAVTNTGGAQSWATKTCPISGATGVHDLYFVFTGDRGACSTSTGGILYGGLRARWSSVSTCGCFQSDRHWT